MKLFILNIARHVPGKLGAIAETRLLRRQKKQKEIDAQAAFEACLRKLGPGQICLDIGANVGLYTKMMADTGATVHAFEPDPWSFEKLQKAVGQRPNVILHEAAVDVSDGELTMRRNPGFADNPDEESWGTSILTYTEGLPTGDTFVAKAIDLKAFLAQLDDDVSLLKLDIEGAEVPLLDALIETREFARIRTAFIETHEINLPELRAPTDDLRQRLMRLPNIALHFH